MTPSPDLSPTEAAIVARFDAAPVPEEVLREQVVAQVSDVLYQHLASHDTEAGDIDWLDCAPAIADAALAVVRDQQPAVMQRVLDLADELDRDSRGALSASDRARDRGDRTMYSVNVRHARVASQAADAIRAAVSGGTGE